MKSTVLALILFLFIPQQSMALSKPAKSDYFLTLEINFLVTRGEGVRYKATYEPRKPLERTMYGTVIFENPVDRKSPFKVDIVITKDQERIMVQSEPMKRIKIGKKYTVKFFLYETEARETRINKHIDKAQFLFPQEAAIQMGIELID